MLRTIEQLELSAPIVRDDPGVWLEAAAHASGMRMRIYARNFELNGCSRGESVPIQIAYRRTSPCLSPFYHLYIDFNGKVMPCCNLRSDVPAHADAVIADLDAARDGADDLFLVYASETMAAWRRGLVGFDRKSGHCATCSFVPFEDTPEHRATQQRLLDSAARVGGEACLSH
jgi:hypothetical protein